MYRLAFIARPPFERYNMDVYSAFRENHDPDAVGIFIASDEKEAAVVRNRFGDDEKIIIVNFSEYIESVWDEMDLEKLKYYEEKYDCAPMWKYIYTDRFLIFRGYDYAVKTAAALFSFWEWVFETYKPQFYYDEAISTLLTYVAYIVGKKTNTKYYSILIIRGAEMELTHHYYLDEPFQHNVYFDENYREVEYTKEEMERAEKYLKTFEDQNSIPGFMNFAKTVPKFQAKYLLLPPLYIRQKFFNKYANNPCSYIYYKAYERVLDPIKFLRRYKKYLKYYKQPDENQKFVYFPLHFQPEASTIVCAPKYEKQLFFIDNLAKGLPADTVLYVKEHYAGLGSREPEFYKELQKYPNVVIIDPWVNSKALIAKCEAVATLTGTAGWEGFLMGKPVIMGGDIFFSNAPGIVQVDDIYDKYMDIMENWKKPEREEVLTYLCGYLRTARKGNMYTLDDNRFDPENIKNVAKSMFDFMEGNKNG